MRAVNSSSRPVELLLVDFSASDDGRSRVALANTDAPMNIHVVHDGPQALRFLRRGEGYAGAPRPDLVLLDVNLPRQDGCEVLADIRRDRALVGIPVVVLTTSDAPEDAAQSYRLKANCYVQKPVDLAEFITAMKSLVNFWFRHVTLPSRR